MVRWLVTPQDGQPAGSGEREPSFVPSGMQDGVPVVAGRFAALVADVHGPDGAAVSARVGDILSRAGDISVDRHSRSLKVSRGKDYIEALAHAAETGRGWMRSRGAHVLVWGEADGTGMRLTLRFLPARPEAEGTAGAFGLGDSLDIPTRFPGELDDVVIATALAAGAASVPAPRDEVNALLAEACERVRPLVTASPAGLEPAQTATVLNCLGNVFATTARLGGDHALFNTAVEAYRKALGILSRVDDPLNWALIQNHLAIALQTVADETGDTDRLEEAVTAYQNVVDTLSCSQHPYDWALANLRLGLVIYRLALRTGQAKRLKNSIDALEASLGVFDRDKSPGKWAEVMNHMGVVMTALGEELTGNAMLERAVGVFSQALEVRERESVPTLWAQTTNNLGAAEFALGKRKQDAALLQQAANHFQDAMEVYRGLGHARRVAVIDKNLERVKRHLAAATG